MQGLPLGPMNGRNWNAFAVISQGPLDETQDQTPAERRALDRHPGNLIEYLEGIQTAPIVLELVHEADFMGS